MTPELLLALSTLIAALSSAVVAVITVLRVGAVKNEVKTMNELTLGQLGEATETRRIDEIPADERTARESRHVAMTKDDVPRPPPDSGRARP